MFILDGKPLSPDVAFTHDDIQYPANWLRLSTPEERDAIGITEVPDPAPYDQRFYWGYDSEGNLIPKDHTQLVEQWTAQTRATANSLLTPTDWIIIREADNGVPADAETKTWRELVRLSAGSKNYEIEQTTTTDELAAYITGPDYPAWPQQNTEPTFASDPVEETVAPTLEPETPVVEEADPV